MASDAKKHSTIAAGEKPTRAALAAAILSINDVIPVANSTEATQVVTALVALGQAVATSPVAVARADARGLHRVELCYDPAGLIWVPLSGVLSFANKAAADAFAAANSALLTASDECMISGTRYVWSGTAWISDGWVDFTPTIANFTLVGGAFDLARYKVSRGLVKVRFQAQVASMGTNPTITLPVNAIDANLEHLVGSLALVPGAGSEVVGAYRKSANNSVVLYYHFISGSNVYLNNIGASAPFAWGATGKVIGSFEYQAA